MDLKFTISGQRLSARLPATLVSDTVGYLNAVFAFSDDWKGLDKWAHLKDDAGNVYDAELVDDRVENLNLTGGRWRLWLHGHEMTDGQPMLRITTGTVEFEVAKSGELAGAVLPVIETSAAEQIAANAAYALAMVKQLRAEADALSGAVREATDQAARARGFAQTAANRSTVAADCAIRAAESAAAANSAADTARDAVVEADNFAEAAANSAAEALDTEQRVKVAIEDAWSIAERASESADAAAASAKESADHAAEAKAAAEKAATGGSTVELDTTLTVEGKAADAKAVGDKITALSSDVSKALTRAEDAEDTADLVFDLARAANNTAGQADTTANKALSQVSSAQSAANSANQKANTAMSTAEEALEVANEALGVANNAGSGADVPEDLIVTSDGDTLTWDGNTNGLVSSDALGAPMYKVSDAVLTVSDFANGYSHMINGVAIASGNTEVIEELGLCLLAVKGEGGCLMASGNSEAFSELNLPPGTYFVNLNTVGYITSLTINGYTGFASTTINTKYLPSDGGNYELTDADKQEIAELAAELVPSGGGGIGGTSETWADDLLASGTLVTGNAVLYDTGITLAKLREYKSFVYKLKGASNTNLSNLYLKLLTNEADNGVSIDRESQAGRIAYFEWADAEKTVLRPVNGYSGNCSMVALGAHAQSNAQAQVCYGVGQYNVMMYIDLSARVDTDRLYFYCTTAPTVDYSFEIRGLTK